MLLSDILLSFGQDTFAQLLRQISISRLKTYQLYEPFKTRIRLAKLNTEALRKGAPRFWARLNEHDEEFARDLSQAILIGQLDMIRAILDFLGIPNSDGFFDKNLDPAKYLAEGWQQKVWDKFHGQFPDVVLRLYINHLGWELGKTTEVFQGAA
jgi:hypothetical protein